MLGPTLETDRLILRPPLHEDFDGYAAFCADPEATRFLGGPISRDDAWRQMASLAGSWALLGYGMFSVIEKASGRWIGRLGPWRPGGAEGGWPGTEVGWGISPAMQRKGYAVEGAAAAMDWAFGALGWDEIIHVIAPENVPSQRVAINLGARNRGPGRLPPPLHIYDVDIWGQTRADWRARRESVAEAR